MAHRTWQSIRKTDAEVVESFRRVAKVMENPDAVRLRIHLYEGHSWQGEETLLTAESNAILSQVLKTNSSIVYQLTLLITAHISLLVIRPQDKPFDNITLNFDQNTDVERFLALVQAINLEFSQISAGATIERVLGSEIAHFYQSRDVALLRLEEIAQRTVGEANELRLKLIANNEDDRRKAEETYSKRQLLLDQSYAEQKKALEDKERELDEYRKTLDDRNSRHARRALRESLQQVLTLRDKEFRLTADTTKKRRPLHITFIALISFGVLYVGSNVYSVLSGGTDVFLTARLTVGVVGVVTAFIFYIRWLDFWFRQHADEEFRLKRMALDVDRASWVVETAMEWQQQNKDAIPPLLLQQLTHDLFSNAGQVANVRHPAEDFASLLGSASNVKLNLPGGSGEATFNKKDIQELTR